MKYLCLVYLDAENWHACPDPHCHDYASALAARGQMLAGAPLHPVATATTVRVRGGDTLVTDGPFAETKEMLAGYYLIEAADLNEAITIAAGIPPARHGSIEVRPLRELQVN